MCRGRRRNQQKMPVPHRVYSKAAGGNGVSQLHFFCAMHTSTGTWRYLKARRAPTPGRELWRAQRQLTTHTPLVQSPLWVPSALLQVVVLVLFTHLPPPVELQL